jgi:hypothetical protein
MARKQTTDKSTSKPPATAKPESKPKSRAPGVISPSDVYRLDEFQARVGWSNDAWRTARSNGLKVIRTQGRAYVRGSDFLDYLDGIARRAEENAQP